jgi:hypothetical protein
MFSLLGKFLYSPIVDVRSDAWAFAFDEIHESSILPFGISSECIRFPFEIGKFLTQKLTYAPEGLAACRELMYHYDKYDLQKVQESLNKAVVENHPEVLNKSAEELSEILDNVWNDQTIPWRIKGLRVGIPLSIAAIGSVAAGPIGAVGGFLAGLGFEVASKFLDLKTEGLSETLAKLKMKSYQSNIYDFKKKYNK